MFSDLLKPMHLLVIVFIALLLFGPSKLADLGKGLGEGIRNFKSAIKEGEQGTTPAAPAATPTNAPGEEKK